jgi:hypothetical protein
VFNFLTLLEKQIANWHVAMLAPETKATWQSRQDFRQREWRFGGGLGDKSQATIA